MAFNNPNPVIRQDWKSQRFIGREVCGDHHVFSTDMWFVMMCMFYVYQYNISIASVYILY